jgi:hypothetical protein
MLLLYTACWVHGAAGPQRNLFGVNPGESPGLFADAVKEIRSWSDTRTGETWKALDAHGYPVLKKEEAVFAGVLSEQHPTGTYVLEYRGQADVNLAVRQGKTNRPLSAVSEKPGQKTYRLDSTDSVVISIQNSDPANPVNNLHLWLPGMADLKPTWHPGMVQDLKKFGTIRFMDMMRTNRSPQQSWKDRAVEQDLFECKRPKIGIPIEWLIDLCNQTQSNPWFCMPHQADDEYVRSFAKMVKTRLDPGLKVYVEYSNEMFNRSFSQFQYACEQGKALNLLKPGESDAIAGARFHGKRTVDMLRIWRDVYGADKNRVIGVITFIVGNDNKLGEVRASLEDYAKEIDAFATAMYPGVGIGKMLKKPIQECTPDDLFEILFEDQKKRICGTVLKRGRELADEFKKPLLGYEGGQHLSFFGGKVDEKDTAAFTALFDQCQASSRMEKFYIQMMNDWHEATDGVYLYYKWYGDVTGGYPFGMKPSHFCKDEDYPKARAAVRLLEAKSLPLECK